MMGGEWRGKWQPMTDRKPDGVHRVARASREIRSQTDVRRVPRRMRGTAGGTPALPETHRPALGVQTAARLPRPHDHLLDDHMGR